MKKNIIATVVALVFAVVANAQSTTYFAPVGETMELGFGFNPQTHKFVLSVIEESKGDVDFDVDVTNAFGAGILSHAFNAGKVTAIPKTRKVNYYECNYELSSRDLNILLFNARHGGKLSINGTTLDGSALIKAINSVMHI